MRLHDRPVEPWGHLLQSKTANEWTKGAKIDALQSIAEFTRWVRMSFFDPPQPQRFTFPPRHAIPGFQFRSILKIPVIPFCIGKSFFRRFAGDWVCGSGSSSLRLANTERDCWDFRD
jgi:hypothetical protein